MRDRSLPNHEFLIGVSVRQVPTQGRELDSRAKALIAARAALEKQAEGVVILDLRSISTVADFFVVCTAGSGRQLDALKDHIEAVLALQGCVVWHTEGSPPTGGSMRSSNHALQWVLMDCGEIVVHLLDQQARTFYRLEELWADAPRVAIPSSAV